MSIRNLEEGTHGDVLEEKKNDNDMKIDIKNDRFPYCIVWTPLPIISWLVPFVGHAGICKQDGAILDFAASYFINVDNFAFGSPILYVPLNLNSGCYPVFPSSHTCKDGSLHSKTGFGKDWDDALLNSLRKFQSLDYNIFTCNCHSFIASCLNSLAYEGKVNWNMVDVVFLVLLKGKWVHYSSIFRALTPFVCIMLLGCYLAGIEYLLLWSLITLILIFWYVFKSFS